MYRHRVPIAALAVALFLSACATPQTKNPIGIRSHTEAEGKASTTIDVVVVGQPTRVLTARADAGGTVDIDTQRTPPVIATGSWKVIRDENAASAPGAIDVRNHAPCVCADGACAPPSTSAAVTEGAVSRCGPLPSDAKPGEVWCCVAVPVPAAPAYQVELAPERVEWQRVDCANASESECWALVTIPAVREMRVPAAPPPSYRWQKTDCGLAPAAAAPAPCAPAAPPPAAAAPAIALLSVGFPNPFGCDEARRGQPVYRNCRGEPATQVNNPSTSPHLPEPGTGWPCASEKVGAAGDPCPHGVAAIVGGIVDLITLRWLGGL